EGWPCASLLSADFTTAFSKVVTLGKVWPSLPASAICTIPVADCPTALGPSGMAFSVVAASPSWERLSSVLAHPLLEPASEGARREGTAQGRGPHPRSKTCMQEKHLFFVIPTYRLRDVGETIEQYDEHFWRNGHSVRMIVFDDSSPANQEKYYPPAGT